MPRLARLATVACLALGGPAARAERAAPAEAPHVTVLVSGALGLSDDGATRRLALDVDTWPARRVGMGLRLADGRDLGPEGRSLAAIEVEVEGAVAVFGRTRIVGGGGLGWARVQGEGACAGGPLGVFSACGAYDHRGLAATLWSGAVWSRGPLALSLFTRFEALAHRSTAVSTGLGAGVAF